MKSSGDIMCGLQDVERAGRGGGWRYLPFAVVAYVAAMSVALVGCGKDPTAVPMAVGSSGVASFRTSDGVELNGRLFGEGSTGVVLAHMYPVDQSSWWEFAQFLADRGYLALTFNFRGYGEGPDRSGGDKDTELIDRDLEAALNFIKAQGTSEVFFIGASMGGTASLKVAAEVTVSGVVSLSAPVKFRGISLEREQVAVPVLLIAAEGDSSAKRNLQTMLDDGIVGATTDSVVYPDGRDHGTDILKGENGDAARERIMGFLEAHIP